MTHRFSLACLVVAVAFGPSGPASAEVGLQPVAATDSRSFGPSVRRSVGPPVRLGIDVLLSDSAHLIGGKRLGLLTNRAGVDAQGVSSIDRLARYPSARLVALFAPEHGMRGQFAPGATVSDTVDAATGLPIYSLYGVRSAPTEAHLAQLDAVVVDLQDVGARPFSWSVTLVRLMRASRATGTRIIVLDRPDPLGGCVIQGPVLDTALASGVGALPVPLRHGMTLGELARFGNDALGIGADLVVVPVQGWRRCDRWDRTGLGWVPPSPNLPDLGSVMWYPGTVLYEATNLSVGRGTDAPFRQVGAPWLDAAALARAMRTRFGLRLDTLTLAPIAPGDGKFAGTPVHFVRLPAYAGRERADPVATALRLLDMIAELQPDSLRVDSANFARHLGVQRQGLQTEWRTEVRAFLARRTPYLLYR